MRGPLRAGCICALRGALRGRCTGCDTRVYKEGPLGALSYEPKFKQDVKTRSKHSGEDVIYGMSGLIRT